MKRRPHRAVLLSVFFICLPFQFACRLRSTRAPEKRERETHRRVTSTAAQQSKRLPSGGTIDTIQPRRGLTFLAKRILFFLHLDWFFVLVLLCERAELPRFCMVDPVAVGAHERRSLGPVPRGCLSVSVPTKEYL
jgi:hypothetical protein